MTAWWEKLSHSFDRGLGSDPMPGVEGRDQPDLLGQRTLLKSPEDESGLSDYLRLRKLSKLLGRFDGNHDETMLMERKRCYSGSGANLND